MKLPEDAWSHYYALGVALATAEPTERPGTPRTSTWRSTTRSSTCFWPAIGPPPEGGRANSDPRCRSEVSALTA